MKKMSLPMRTALCFWLSARSKRGSSVSASSRKLGKRWEKRLIGSESSWESVEEKETFSSHLATFFSWSFL